ncbi:hypothetical protein F511_18109 [Dorcoceras hygrometricum]|uniref:Uncharacterized protein n=1 Tax=Dorcoceras hygrometricum TaxID=472368 RepID=A0A2Z7BA84_9LAMI|nr:hypothetical protein F511_18109 [Dorcoceras hygrometricum]
MHDEFGTDGTSRKSDRNKSDHDGGGAAASGGAAAVVSTCVTLNGSRIQLAVGPQPLWLRNRNFGLAQRIMVKCLATSPYDPLGITDSVRVDAQLANLWRMDSDLVIYRTTLVRTFQVVTICRVDKSELRMTAGAAAQGGAIARATPCVGQCNVLRTGRPPCASVAHGYARCPPCMARPGHACRGRACGRVPHAICWWRPPSGESPAAMRRLFSSTFCSGLSRTAHEVFEPIFDVGPILVGPKN